MQSLKTKCQQIVCRQENKLYAILLQVDCINVEMTKNIKSNNNHNKEHSNNIIML